MHPVTRVERVIQQLKSFADLHAAEMDALALELEAAGAPEVAAKLRVYRTVQRDEGQLVVDELVDIRAALVAETPAPAADGEASANVSDAAWTNSPKRAQWLADEAARTERAQHPRTRRELLRGTRDPS